MAILARKHSHVRVAGRTVFERVPQFSHHQYAVALAATEGKAATVKFKAWQPVVYLVTVRSWESPTGWTNRKVPARFLYYTPRGRCSILAEGYRRVIAVLPTSLTTDTSGAAP